MIGAGVVALVVVVAAGAFLLLRGDSSPIDPAERAAVVSFTEDVLDIEGMREGVLVEFGQVGIDIRTTDFSVVFRTLESVIAKQERLAGGDAFDRLSEQCNGIGPYPIHRLL